MNNISKMADKSEHINEIRAIGIYILDEDGKYHNITDLDRKNYEDFLETMHRLRLAYIVATQKR